MNISHCNLAPEYHPPEGRPAPRFTKNSYPVGNIKDKSSSMLENKKLELLNMVIEALKSYKKSLDLQSEYWEKKIANETACKNCTKTVSTEDFNNKSNIEKDFENTSGIVISEVMQNVDILIEEQDLY